MILPYTRYISWGEKDDRSGEAVSVFQISQIVLPQKKKTQGMRLVSHVIEYEISPLITSSITFCGEIMLLNIRDLSGKHEAI